MAASGRCQAIEKDLEKHHVKVKQFIGNFLDVTVTEEDVQSFICYAACYAHMANDFTCEGVWVGYPLTISYHKEDL